MKTKRYLPQNIVKLIDWATRFFAYLNLHYTRWKIDESLISEVAARFAEMQAAYHIYSKPETHSPMYHGAMMKKKKIFVAAARQLAQYLAHNPGLEPQDFDGLGINKPNPGPHPKHPRPKTSPKMRFAIGEEHGWIYLHFWDELSEGSKAKPFGTQGAEIKWIFCRPGEEPGSVDELINTAFATRTPSLFELTDRQSGMILCVAMRWENTRGEKGPWSHIETVIIP
ncbi:MAG: hypothetical protein LBK22_09765 [Tannerella sp.]|jgi:hypothetical protein|nr:hypothetical protein [Tannerella sp.]